MLPHLKVKTENKTGKYMRKSNFSPKPQSLKVDAPMITHRIIREKHNNLVDHNSTDMRKFRLKTKDTGGNYV